MKPIHIELKNMVIKNSSGESHSLALTSENKIISWGCNVFGQLGRDFNSSIGPTEIQI